MNIFPIVKGQKPKQENAIPEFVPKTEAPAPAPAAPAATKQDDLIDFGQSEEPAKEQQTPKQPSEIESMLASTGKPADGPLIDFTQELKKDLPTDTKQ
jgi:hypothetical protein